VLLREETVFETFTTPVLGGRSVLTGENYAPGRCSGTHRFVALGLLDIKLCRGDVVGGVDRLLFLPIPCPLAFVTRPFPMDVFFLCSDALEFLTAAVSVGCAPFP